MTGARLEVNVHIVTGSQSSSQNVVACVNRAGVKVADTMVEQLAASEAVLTDERKSSASRSSTSAAARPILRSTSEGASGIRRSSARRRSLHQRHRRRPAHARPGRGEDQAEVRVRAVGDGRRRRNDRSGERRRAQAPHHRAPDPVRDSPAARRGDLPPGLGRDAARRLREEPQFRDRAHRRRSHSRWHAGSRGANIRSSGPPRGSGRPQRVDRSRQQDPSLRPAWASCSTRGGTNRRDLPHGCRRWCVRKGRPGPAETVRGDLLRAHEEEDPSASRTRRRKPRNDTSRRSRATDRDDATESPRLRLQLKRPPAVGRAHQGDRRRRRRHERGGPHDAGRSRRRRVPRREHRLRRCRHNSAPKKLQIGNKVTKGLGAGADPDVGEGGARRHGDRSSSRSRGPTWCS